MSSSTPNTSPPLSDTFHRQVSYARIAVTGACNLRCAYCMREEHESDSSGRTKMSFTELTTLISVLAEAGITKIRLTGGEPLLRGDIADLVATAKNTPGIKTVSITTNGLLLDRHLDALLSAGIDAVNMSIDSLRADRFLAITRRNEFERAKANLDRLLSLESVPLKINVVMLRGINDDEIKDFTNLTREHPISVRFMELQPFDDHQIWRTGKFLGMDKIRGLLQSAHPGMEELQGSGTEYFSFTLPGYRGSWAIIPAYTRNFCSRCNRLRIRADGHLVSCLYEKEGIDMLSAIRNGESRENLLELVRQSVRLKPEDGKTTDRGESSMGRSMSEIGG
ncbi:GTP 3',8-cyclase MoaA [Chlorobium phaeovibrioides]|uniref:GTP 3',8-cyclase MoaA n=1 Tax=Chlorobium phaeovibrioides TaxID=1094 RepID=UPI00163A5343|nr:GTP 3',8-cyclase MoaA [Chlorobium phaeovibrioides]